jgi:hypothetical protein
MCAGAIGSAEAVFQKGSMIEKEQRLRHLVLDDRNRFLDRGVRERPEDGVLAARWGRTERSKVAFNVRDARRNSKGSPDPSSDASAKTSEHEERSPVGHRRNLEISRSDSASARASL